MDSCLFCKILKGLIPSKKAYEEETLCAFYDRNPVAPYHILIVPKKHIASVSETRDADQTMLGNLFLAAQKIAIQEQFNDYRLVVNNGPDAGQTVFHLHVHLLAGRSFTWPPG
jgi:histidine triad (HIT) family protein